MPRGARERACDGGRARGGRANGRRHRRRCRRRGWHGHGHHRVKRRTGRRGGGCRRAFAGEWLGARKIAAQKEARGFGSQGMQARVRHI